MNKLAEDLSGIRFIPQKELCVESVDELEQLLSKMPSQRRVMQVSKQVNPPFG